MKWRAWYVMGPAMAALAAIAVLSFLWYQRHEEAFLSTDPGSPEGCAVVETPRGPIAVVLDHVEHGRAGRRGAGGAQVSGHRMVALDARTGAQLALSVRDTGYTTCWGAAPSRMWCQLADEVHVVGVPGFETIATMNSLIAKAHLAAPLKHSWRADGSAIVTKLADGRNARVDAASLAAAEVADEYLSGAQPPDSTRCHLESHLDLGDHATLKFGSATRAPLVLEQRGADDVAYDATFLSPKFVITSDPALALVLHAVSLDRTEPMNLTRLDANHHVAWNTTIPGDCETANVTGSTLVVSTQNSRGRAVGIDIATGKIEWKLTFAE